MVAALTDSTSARSLRDSVSRPCRSSAGSSAGIITLSRFPQTRSDASHNAVTASWTGAIVLAFARGLRLGLGRLGRPVSAKRPHRMLAMPARCRAQLIENAPLVRPTSRPVAPRHRRHHLPPSAHADLPRHGRQRPDSLAQPQSWQDFFGNILDEAMRPRRSPPLLRYAPQLVAHLPLWIAVAATFRWFSCSE
jgi:hypothetical protein